MVSPRAALSAGAAAAAAAGLLLSGGVDGSAIAAMVLVLVARAAPAAASADPPDATLMLSRTTSLVTVWVPVVLAGVVRAGSGTLGDVRGANAVAGLSLFHGEALVVLGCWLAVVAGTVALVAPVRGGLVVSASPLRRLELLAVALQAALLVTLFAGPQISGARDLVPWTIGAVVAAVAITFGPQATWMHRVPAAASAAAVAGLVLVSIGARP